MSTRQDSTTSKAGIMIRRGDDSLIRTIESLVLTETLKAITYLLIVLIIQRKETKMNTYKKITKQLVTLFFLVNIPLFVAMFCFRYSMADIASNLGKVPAFFWILSIGLIYLPFEAFIAYYAKRAEMKKSSIAFCVFFGIHFLVVVGSTILLLVA